MSMKSMEDKLFDILKDLNYYKHDKNDLLKQYVQDRLQTAMNSYYSELVVGLESLLSYDEKTVMRKMLKNECKSAK